MEGHPLKLARKGEEALLIALQQSVQGRDIGNLERAGLLFRPSKIPDFGCELESETNSQPGFRLNHERIGYQILRQRLSRDWDRPPLCCGFRCWLC